MLNTDNGDLIGSGSRRARRFMRTQQVVDTSGLPLSTIYEKMALGEFPRPIRLTPRRVGWLEDEIIAWQEARIAASRQTEASS